MMILRTMISLENLPVCKTKEEHTSLCDEIIKQGGIPKQHLETGVTYEGISRNTNLAKWNGEYFTYLRYKFGTSFVDKIKHFEDDMVYDVFIPLKRCI
jgi:hypothetical protein